MPHDIIDNRRDKLVDHLNGLLPQSLRARFAVGYFFLSGFSSIASKLRDVGELRILIGNTTTRETIEQLAEGYRRLELVERTQQRRDYATDRERKQWGQDTAQNVQSSMELMDQTDETAELVATLAQLIEEKRVKVKVYTKGRLHAKAYIFDYTTEHYEPGLGIVGSSNLTVSGIQHNTELNVVVHGSNNHEVLVKWFDELWDEAQDFDEALLHELKRSWALNPVTPYDIYVKTLYALVKDRLEEEEGPGLLWDREMPELADFQRAAMNAAVRMLNRYGGVFVSDVVGLGKTYIGSALLKYYRTVHRMRPVIFCPASMVRTWEDFSHRYDLGPVISTGLLTEHGIDLDRDPRTEDRDIVLIDESDEFRYSGTQRHGKLRTWLSKQPRKVILLTATPRNNTAWDIYNQLKLFHPAERSEIPILPARLREYFKEVENGNKRLQDLLRHILIRRTRKHIQQYYPDAVLPDGRRIVFPRRELDTVSYSIEDTYEGVYARLRDIIRGMRYARYGLGDYVKTTKRGERRYRDLSTAGQNLRGLMRVMLFKRFESSVHAFRLSVQNMLLISEAFLQALEQGIVPAGTKAQELLYTVVSRSGAGDWDDGVQLQAALEQVSGLYDVADFDVELLRQHIQEDMRCLEEMKALVDPITPDGDTKLQCLLARLAQPPCKDRKVVIFTQFSDTLDYLYENLQHLPHLERIDSDRGSPMTIVARFAPRANPQYTQPGQPSIDNLLSTDVLAKGLNLQDGNVVINYDIHWNPVRLIQRVGRVDRIGTEHDVVHALNFLPETELDKGLGLRDRVRHRIAEIHSTIGEDAQILERNEKLNEEAMYRIYESRDASILDPAEPEDMDILAEAEAFMRRLQRDNPEYFAKIASTPDGVRSSKETAKKGTFTFCQAGDYQQLYLVDEDGSVVTTDIEDVLAVIRCPPDQERATLPPTHNRAVNQALRDFRTQVAERYAQGGTAPKRRRGQAYVANQLRSLLRETKEASERETIVTLERALSSEALSPEIHKELNRLRRDKVSGADLVVRLTELYRAFGLGTQVDRQVQEGGRGEQPVPRIVCSEALV